MYLKPEPTQHDLAKGQLNHISPLAWTIDNGIKTENEKLIEFSRHRFMVQPMNDMHPRQVTRKSAQVGWTTMNIIKSFYMSKEYGLNVIYTLPTRTVVKDFVAPKVDKIYSNNKVMKDAVGKDSESLKQIGSRFIYYRGAWSDTEAIMISADLLINDEKDKSDQSVLDTYDSRLQASEWQWKWEYSNPTIPGYGIDEDYQNSDQMHWFITCSKCGHFKYIDFEKSGYQNHYVDVESVTYRCGGCHEVLPDSDRQDGEWIAKFPMDKHPEITVRGYWLSQLMVPYVPASYIVEKSKGDPEFFHNFVLGKAWQPADMRITRQMITQNCAPGKVDMTHMALGVDNGVTKSWVLGNEKGVSSFGETEDWDVIEGFIKAGAVAVIDANPYPRVPKMLVKKYPGRVFINYYSEDTKNLGAVRFKEGDDAGVILSDRTRVFDDFVSDLANQKFYFYLTITELEEYIDHCEALYRVVEENARGIQRGFWKKMDGKPDHYAHATIYQRIAQKLIRELKDTGVVRSAPAGTRIPKGVSIDKHGRMKHDIDIDELARGSGKTRRTWENT